MFQWIRRSFIAGFFVTVPLVISVAAFIWIFRLIDGFVGPFYTEWLKTRLGREDPVPGLGILTTALVVLLVGAIATNVIGKRLLQRAESYLLKVPVFRTIYAPVKQLVVAFSPDNEYGFKRVVMVEDRARGFVLGFLTKEFTVDRGQGPEALIAVYVPDEPPLSRRRAHHAPRAGVLPRHHRGAGHPDLPDRRHGALEPHPRAPGRRSSRRVPSLSDPASFCGDDFELFWHGPAVLTRVGHRRARILRAGVPMGPAPCGREPHG